MATSGDLDLATSGDFFMATDNSYEEISYVRTSTVYGSTLSRNQTATTPDWARWPAGRSVNHPSRTCNTGLPSRNDATGRRLHAAYIVTSVEHFYVHRDSKDGHATPYPSGEMARQTMHPGDWLEILDDSPGGRVAGNWYVMDDRRKLLPQPDKGLPDDISELLQP